MRSLLQVGRQRGAQAGRGGRGLSPEYRNVRLEGLPGSHAGARHGGGGGDQRGGGEVEGLLGWGEVLVSWYPVEIAVANTAAQGALPAPGSVRSDGDLPAVVCLRVVDVQLERPPFVGLDQTEEILALVEDTVGS